MSDTIYLDGVHGPEPEATLIPDPVVDISVVMPCLNEEAECRHLRRQSVRRDPSEWSSR